MVTLPSSATDTVTVAVSEGSSALATMQISCVSAGSTRTVRPSVSQAVTTSTGSSLLYSTCALMSSWTADTATKVLSPLNSTLPSSSVCVTVNEIGWPSSEPVQLKVAPASASMSAGQLTSVGATPVCSSVSAVIWRCASAESSGLDRKSTR